MIGEWVFWGVNKGIDVVAYTLAYKAEIKARIKYSLTTSVSMQSKLNNSPWTIATLWPSHVIDAAFVCFLHPSYEY